MALCICNRWRYPISQIPQIMGKTKLLASRIQNHSSLRNYRNLSFGDYKMGLSEKLYIWSLPLIFFTCIIDKEKLKRMIRGEDTENVYNAEEVASAFPNAEVVRIIAKKDPEKTTNSSSQ
ncbi:hypothetical protein LSTR_LSTR006373 [Laodelphax striatellus]|uniref:Uncharacterized protein n=1 Tax=Laodelphax striatellus TaxID=195883 RepID=A0A482XDR3_LAOST|nr:hypothetical protein LSTR_LSTR006373 [Laodelphax striatellus]